MPVFHSLPTTEVALPGSDAWATSVLRRTGYTWDPKLRGYMVSATTRVSIREAAIAALVAAGRPVTHHIDTPAGVTGGYEPQDAAVAFTRSVSEIAYHLSSARLRVEPGAQWSCIVEHNPTRSTRRALADHLWRSAGCRTRLQDRKLASLAILHRGGDERHLLLTDSATNGRVPNLALAITPASFCRPGASDERLPATPQLILPGQPKQAAIEIQNALRPQLRSAKKVFAEPVGARIRTARPDVVFRSDDMLGPLAITTAEGPPPPRVHRILSAAGFEPVGNGTYAHRGSSDQDAARAAIAGLRADGVSVRDNLPAQRDSRVPGTPPWAAPTAATASVVSAGTRRR